MKHVLKNLFAILALTVVFVSCNNEDDAIVYGPVGLQSFGFYAEDNEGVLFQDYVVLDSTSTALTVFLPEEADKSQLVARFTTTPDDVVTVNGVEQESGVTANDFSSPVDYILTEGTNNVRITVTVTTAPAFVWSELPAFDADTVGSLVMKVNPVDGLPYMLYKKNYIASADEKAGVVKYNAGTWEFVGGEAGASEGQIGTYFDINFDESGKPAIVFADYTAATAQQSTAMSFDGTAWTVLGSKGFTADKVTYTAIVKAPKASWMTFSMFDGRSGPLARRALSWSNFDNGSWTADLTLPGRAESLNAYMPKTKVVGDSLFLGIFNAGLKPIPNSISLYKYVDGNWSVLVDQYIPDGSTNINLRDFDMEVTKDGKIFVLTGANSNDAAGFYKPTLTLFDPEMEMWIPVGTPINIDLGTVRYMDLALSPYGVPSIAYKNELGYASVVEFDLETMDWKEAVTLDDVEIDDIYLDFAPNGVGYVATEVEGTIHLYKFDAPNN